MKLLTWSSVRVLLTGFAALVFVACENTSQQATGGQPSATAVTTTPQIVLPVASGANQPPVYPVSMLAGSKPGMVYVDCVVDESGQVMLATVQNSTHSAFTKSTLEAVRGWTFKPGTRNGAPVAMRVIVPVEYKVED